MLPNTHSGHIESKVFYGNVNNVVWGFSTTV